MSLKPGPRKVNDRILSPELRAKIDGKLDKISAEAIYRKKPIPTDPETLIKMDELSAAVRSAIQSGGGGEPGSGGGSYGDMVKAVYDTNDDGIVDVAETVIGNEIQLGSYKLVYNSTINSLDIEVIA